MLLLLIVYFLKYPLKNDHVIKFTRVVLFLSCIQLIMMWVVSDEEVNRILRISEYYTSKGIETNTLGGLKGTRLLFPMYSTGLLGAFLTFALFSVVGRRTKVIAFVGAVFTMSKVLILFPVLFLLRRRPWILFLLVVSIFVVLPYGINWFLANSDASILTFHAASIRDRFNIIPYFLDNLSSMGIGQLGSNSVAGYVLAGLDASRAPESLLISRLMDYGIFFPVFLFQLFLLALALEKKQRRIFIAILILFLFTSLSNHPIAFIPLLFSSYRWKRNSSSPAALDLSVHT